MADKISLRLVKMHGYEVICDQDGRPLGDVLSFSYSCSLPGDSFGGGPILEVKVRSPAAEWDEAVGREVSRKKVSS